MSSLYEGWMLFPLDKYSLYSESEDAYILYKAPGKSDDREMINKSLWSYFGIVTDVKSKYYAFQPLNRLFFDTSEDDYVEEGDSHILIPKSSPSDKTYLKKSRWAFVDRKKIFEAEYYIFEDLWANPSVLTESGDAYYNTEDYNMVGGVNGYAVIAKGGGQTQNLSYENWDFCGVTHDNLGAFYKFSPKNAVPDEVNEEDDPVSHPKHYTSRKSGIECIDVTEEMNFCLGNAVKYIWRCDEKGHPIEDLKKAIWYIQREIDRREVNESQSSEVKDFDLQVEKNEVNPLLLENFKPFHI